MRGLVVVLVLLAAPLAGCLGSTPTPTNDPVPEDPPVDPFVPHVIVAIPDSGINPYHELYYRPNLTAHPCTYIRDFPCDIEALNLTLGGDDYEAAVEADEGAWASVTSDKWYWIPQTVFVAVSCRGGTTSTCVLDDNGMHGTGTTSSVITENPDALLAFREGGSAIGPFAEAGIPVDIFSVSWGYRVPIPAAGPAGELLKETTPPLYVKAAGNNPWSTTMTHWSGDPDVISVGGAYAQDQSEDPMATKQPDVVSYYCRPTAQTQETHELRESYCGTSFAAPTVAGALSKVILHIREANDYDGSILPGGILEPNSGLTAVELREALNMTATYDPEPSYPNTAIDGIPLNPVAPWLQWGWGFYDGKVADVTIAYLTGADATVLEDKSGAQDWMDTQHDVKKILYD